MSLDIETIAPEYLYAHGPLFIIGKELSIICEVYINGELCINKSFNDNILEVQIPEIDIGIYSVIIIKRHNNTVQMSNSYNIKISG